MNDFLKSKKNIISVLTLLILILAIPQGMRLIEKEKILRSRAVEAQVTFSGPNVVTRGSRSFLKLDADGNAKVDLIITAPNAPGATSVAAPLPTPGGGSTTGGGGASLEVTE